MPDTPPPVAAALEAQAAEASWHRFTATEQGPDGPQAEDAAYGGDLPTETDLRLLGPIAGRRLLDLGCGTGQAAVAFARQGARVIGVDPSPDRLAAARRLADEEGVRVELHLADLAELAFLRADTVHAVFSAFALAEVTDISRVFRQAHRVLRPEGPLAFSIPHPAFTMIDPTATDPLRIVRAYDDRTPLTRPRLEGSVTDHPRTIGEVFASLTRANFKVDTLLEPTAPASGHRSRWYADVMRHVPAAVVFRARKQGN